MTAKPTSTLFHYHIEQSYPEKLLMCQHATQICRTRIAGSHALVALYVGWNYPTREDEIHKATYTQGSVLVASKIIYLHQISSILLYALYSVELHI